MEAWGIIWDALPTLLQGMLLTFEVTIISLLLAIVIGLFFGILRISKKAVLNAIAVIYVDLIRGTPLLIQILFIYFGLPSFLGIKITAFTAGIAAIAINAGAYLVEIFRGGIESINRGQMEAGRSLGFSYAQTMLYIIFPQALRRMIPAIVNQFIISLKDTSMLSVIGITELTMQGQSIYSVNFRAFEILSAVAVLYFVIIYILTAVSRWIERRLRRYD